MRQLNRQLLIRRALREIVLVRCFVWCLALLQRQTGRDSLLLTFRVDDWGKVVTGSDRF